MSDELDIANVTQKGTRTPVKINVPMKILF